MPKPRTMQEVKDAISRFVEQQRLVSIDTQEKCDRQQYTTLRMLQLVVEGEKI